MGCLSSMKKDREPVSVKEMGCKLKGKTGLKSLTKGSDVKEYAHNTWEIFAL